MDFYQRGFCPCFFFVCGDLHRFFFCLAVLSVVVLSVGFCQWLFVHEEFVRCVLGVGILFMGFVPRGFCPLGYCLALVSGRLREAVGVVWATRLSGCVGRRVRAACLIGFFMKLISGFHGCVDEKGLRSLHAANDL